MEILKTILILLCYHVLLGGLLLLVVYWLGFHWYTVLALSVVTVAFNYIDRLSDRALRDAEKKQNDKRR